MNTYRIEVTDTFGGEANYSWVRRYTVQANCTLGAIRKLGALYDTGWRKDHGDNMFSCYRLAGACVIAFVECEE